MIPRQFQRRRAIPDRCPLGQHLEEQQEEIFLISQCWMPVAPPCLISQSWPQCGVAQAGETLLTQDQASETFFAAFARLTCLSEMLLPLLLKLTLMAEGGGLLQSRIHPSQSDPDCSRGASEPTAEGCDPKGLWRRQVLPMMPRRRLIQGQELVLPLLLACPSCDCERAPEMHQEEFPQFPL